MDETIRMSVEEFEARMRAGGPPTPDDVTILTDGRHLDSKEAVLEWWAEVEAERAAGRMVVPDDETA